MAANKTAPTTKRVADYLASISDPRRRHETETVMNMMARVTGEPAVLWGPSIIGFGRYHYRYESGREGDWFLTGVSPRKQALTVYIMQGFGEYDELMTRLGPHRTGKSCLYISKLERIDFAALENLVARSVTWMREKYDTP